MLLYSLCERHHRMEGVTRTLSDSGDRSRRSRATVDDSALKRAATKVSIPTSHHPRSAVEARLQIIAEPLDAEAFAPFGEVIEHRGAERRHYLSAQLGALPELKETIWVSRFSEGAVSPARFDRLEHHPFSDQIFVPLKGQSFLALTCPKRADGSPDIGALRAFRSKAGQGIIWRRGVWHGSMTVLAWPAEFFVAMGVRGTGDDVFLELPQPVDVVFEALANV